MPNATTTLGWTVANWGSAPSAWPSASSCTASNDVFFADEDMPSVPLILESCPTDTIDDCWPTPTSSDLVNNYLANRRNVPYWSPGVQCPSGWESVGAASRPSSGSITTTGIFTIGAIPTNRWDDDDPFALESQGALAAVLDPSETAIGCCPRSMSVAPNGFCYSTLPSHSISTACYGPYTEQDLDLQVVSTTFVLWGVTRTGRVVAPTVTIPRTPASTTTTTLNSDQIDDLVAATFTAPVYLVHRASDRNNSSDSNDTSTSDGGSGSDSDASNETNAASRLGVGESSSWAQVKGMAGVLALSMLAGMALVAPW
ncbi:hypothetical protein BJX76DRAFT_361393 [Aspergillus varians]